ncbi:MAG TPA: diacylglycerol kinase family protein [Candidatus Udaeobacter sp.]|nr:diacylglycerol kinase family protein [Candidatus Udaeobacter sp.]
MPNQIRLSELKVGAIINTASGSCDLESEQAMLGILTRMGAVNPKVWCGEGKQMEDFVADASRQKLDIFIVLGGDGTIRRAAETCSETSPLLIPLPGGTMNMLPRALYGDLSWEEALETTLAAPSTKELSAGRVGSRQFLVAAIVGTPALWVEAREAVRDGGIIEVIEKGNVALKNMFGTKLRYNISDQANGEAETLVVICPLVSQEMSGSEQALEVAAIGFESAAEVIRLATAAAFGKWRDDEKVQVTRTRRLTVQSDKEIPATVDGENVNLGSHAEIEFLSRALTVLVPGK